MEEKIKEYMQRLAKHQYFNGSVLVAHKGKVILNEGYGFSDLNYEIRNTPNTKFRIGSLTKAFTAMAIMLLHERGKLNINDTIDTIFPNYPNGNIITIFHLLTHSSGIPNFTSSSLYWENKMRLPSTLQSTIDSFKNLSLEFEPGERMEYNNSGYLVLTAIIEKVSGVSYEEYLKTNIFKQLCMEDTGVDNGRKIIPNRAEGYTIWEQIIHTEFIDMSFPLGAYGMYSTVNDLYKWCQALIKSEFIIRSLQDQMFTPYKGGYGFGWFIDEVASHLGDVNGFVNYLYLDIKKETVIIVLSNVNITPVTKIAVDLAQIINKNIVELCEDFCVEEVPVDIQKYAGQYTSEKGILSIEFEGNLFAIVPKMYGVPYKFKVNQTKENHQMFKSEYIHDTYFFELDEKGLPISCKLIDMLGNEIFYRRISV